MCFGWVCTPEQKSGPSFAVSLKNPEDVSGFFARSPLSLMWALAELCVDDAEVIHGACVEAAEELT